MVRPGYNVARRTRGHAASGTGALPAEPIPGCLWPGEKYCQCDWCWEHRWPMTDEEETDSESESEGQPPAKKPKVEDSKSKSESVRDPANKV